MMMTTAPRRRRRQRLPWHFLLFLLFFVAPPNNNSIWRIVAVSSSARKRKQQTPNLIVLFVDDLGYGDLGFTGHPSVVTPNIDDLAYHGKILTSWYSGCNVCSGSRAALLTGRQFPRYGVPGVYGPTERSGLPLNETTLAEHLKEKAAGYATAIVGKWHLGQRHVYLPANRGFDQYLGIPYSDDMGNGIRTPCGRHHEEKITSINPEEIVSSVGDVPTDDHNAAVNNNDPDDEEDPAAQYLPLVLQDDNHTFVLEQPVDFSTLANKYSAFATDFIRQQQAHHRPFFLYMPFSHVHTTSNTQPHKQYAGCDFVNSTNRGPFGDALTETDWIIGNIMSTLRELDLEEDTLILFTSDNGPWLAQGALSAGTAGLLTGQYAEGYSDTGKGSTWEGGIRMPAFAYWKNTIPPFTRSAEIISSLDVFPTLSRLAGCRGPCLRTAHTMVVI